MSMTEVETTKQDEAEAFWSRLAPELPPDMLKRIARTYGAHRQVTASMRKIELAKAANARCGWNVKDVGFIKTQFGRIVFSVTI
jgi:hypothetical protein